MSDHGAENELIDNVEPPEVKLSAPALSQTIGTWLVVAKNKRVNRDWEALIQRYR